MRTVAQVTHQSDRYKAGNDTMLKVEKVADERGRLLIQDPPVARFLFQTTAAAWLWLLVRLWLGWQWLTAGWAKLGNPDWMDGSGTALLSFWQRAVAIPPPPARPAITYDWYRRFLQFLIDTQSASWFSYLIVFGELAVGLGLILGALVGPAAAGGLTMNLAYMLAGSTSINPVLAVLQVLLILAWKNAGYLGLDRYLLPILVARNDGHRRRVARPGGFPRPRSLQRAPRPDDAWQAPRGIPSGPTHVVPRSNRRRISHRTSRASPGVNNAVRTR